MSARPFQWFPTALVIALAIAALAFSVRTLRDTPSRIAQIERRKADWQRLHEAAQRVAADRATLAETTKNGPALNIADWMRTQRPTWTAEVREKERERISENWSVQRAQVTIPNVNLADFGTTLDALAAQNPPWRAAEISISAVESGAGRGRVSLLLEGVVKTTATAP